MVPQSTVRDESPIWGFPPVTDSVTVILRMSGLHHVRVAGICTMVLEMIRYKRVHKSHVSRFVTAAPTRLPAQTTYLGHRGLHFATSPTCNGRLVRVWQEFPMLLHDAPQIDLKTPELLFLLPITNQFPRRWRYQLPTTKLVPTPR